MVGLASAARLQPPLAAAGAASSSFVGGGGGLGAVVAVRGGASSRGRALFLSRRQGYHAGGRGEGGKREGGREGGMTRIMAAFVGGRGGGGMLHAQTTRLVHQRQANTCWPAVSSSSSLFLPPPPCSSSLFRARSSSLSFSSLAYEGGRGGEGEGGEGGLPHNDAPIIRTRSVLTPLHATTSSSSSSSSPSSSSPSASAVTSKPQRTKQQQQQQHEQQQHEQQQQQQRTLSSSSYLEKGEGEGEDEVYGLKDTYLDSATEAVGGGAVPGGREGSARRGTKRREGGREEVGGMLGPSAFWTLTSPSLPPSLPPSGHPSPPYELLPEERVEGVTVVRDVKGARRAIQALYAHKNSFFAVDTEVGREGERVGRERG